MDTTRVPVFQELTVNTNIEYDIDWSLFPVIADGSRRMQPMLMIHKDNCPCMETGSTQPPGQPDVTPCPETDLYTAIDSVLDSSEEFGFPDGFSLVSSIPSTDLDDISDNLTYDNCPFGAASDCQCLQAMLEEFYSPVGKSDQTDNSLYCEEAMPPVSPRFSRRLPTPTMTSLNHPSSPQPHMTSTPLRKARTEQRENDTHGWISSSYDNVNSFSDDDDQDFSGFSDVGDRQFSVFSDAMEARLTDNSSLEQIPFQSLKMSNFSEDDSLECGGIWPMSDVSKRTRMLSVPVYPSPISPVNTFLSVAYPTQ